jgi:hypothetical protein
MFIQEFRLENISAAFYSKPLDSLFVANEKEVTRYDWDEKTSNPTRMGLITEKAHLIFTLGEILVTCHATCIDIHDYSWLTVDPDLSSDRCSTPVIIKTHHLVVKSFTILEDRKALILANESLYELNELGEVVEVLKAPRCTHITSWKEQVYSSTEEGHILVLNGHEWKKLAEAHTTVFKISALDNCLLIQHPKKLSLLKFDNRTRVSLEVADIICASEDHFVVKNEQGIYRLFADGNSTRISRYQAGDLFYLRYTSKGVEGLSILDLNHTLFGAMKSIGSSLLEPLDSGNCCIS